MRSQVRALLSPPSRAWSRMRSKRLLIFIKFTRDKAGIFFSSSIQRDAGPNSFWVQRYFLCLTARPNSSSSFSVPLYSGEWPQTKRALCFFQSEFSFSRVYSHHLFNVSLQRDYGDCCRVIPEAASDFLSGLCSFVKNPYGIML